MADELKRITIICDPDFKISAKQAIMENGISSFQDGYLEIFRLGLERLRKGERVDGKRRAV